MAKKIFIFKKERSNVEIIDLMTKQILVPDIGDFENVEVIEVLVKQGDEIKINDPLITLESDKSSVEIPSVYWCNRKIKC